MDGQVLEPKKRGRPLLLGEELDVKSARIYRVFTRVWCTRIVMAAAEGIVKGVDSNLLSSNGGGGHIVCGKHWAKNFLIKSNGFCQEKGEYHC